MSEDFPPNSHKMKKSLRDEPEEIEAAPEKKVEKVVEGKVIRRKKPLGKRFKEVFIGGDAQSVGQYVFFDILIPAAKDLAVDMASQGAERLFFGEDNYRRSSRSRNRHSATRIYHDYQRYSSRDPRDRPPSPRESGRYSRRHLDTDDIILATRAEAEEVIDRMYDLLNRYEVVAVAELYELIGESGGPYTNSNWGWTDLRGTGIRRVREGYLLDLPRPEPLK